MQLEENLMQASAMHTWSPGVADPARPLDSERCIALAGIRRMTPTRALAHLRDEGIVSWHGLSPKDPRATWKLQ